MTIEDRDRAVTNRRIDNETDWQIRINALQLAIDYGKAHHRTPAELVEDATRFVAFLKGSEAK